MRDICARCRRKFPDWWRKPEDAQCERLARIAYREILHKAARARAAACALISLRRFGRSALMKWMPLDLVKRSARFVFATRKHPIGLAMTFPITMKAKKEEESKW